MHRSTSHISKRVPYFGSCTSVKCFRLHFTHSYAPTNVLSVRGVWNDF
jgi:hypothetical protein